MEDLEAAVKEKDATRKALRDAFSQVAGTAIWPLPCIELLTHLHHASHCMYVCTGENIHDLSRLPHMASCDNISSLLIITSTIAFNLCTCQACQHLSGTLRVAIVLQGCCASIPTCSFGVHECCRQCALRHATGSFSGGASGSGQPRAVQPPSGPSASAVVNLGVVGRGSKRINLQPVAAAALPAGGDAAGDSPATSSSSSAVPAAALQ